jgi:hypothetical protein
MDLQISSENPAIDSTHKTIYDYGILCQPSNRKKRNFTNATTATLSFDQHAPLTRHVSWFRSNNRKVKAAVPETPYLLAGAFGGPFVIFGLTPFRNAITLGAQDRTSSGRTLYRQTFDLKNGMCRGWTGGMYPGVAAVPQFMILGPFFHACRQLGLPTAGAVAACGAAETFITFGSHTRNAQLAYLRAHPKATLPYLQNPMQFWGSGMGVHFLRNCVALSGFRLVSGNIRDPLEKLTHTAGIDFSRGTMNILSDFSGCICSAILSAPINQTYNYIVTTPQFKQMSYKERLTAIRKYLAKQYLNDKGRISKVVYRDLTMRCIYVSCAFSAYGFIERTAVDKWQEHRPPKQF